MNELVKQSEIKICPSLTKHEAEFVVASVGEKIRFLNPNKVKLFLVALISKTHLECGQNIDETAVELTIEDLVKDVIYYCTNLTLENLSHAFKLGSMKEFGDWFGLNNNTYRQWIRSYLGYERRLDANKRQNNYLKELNKPKELSQEEKDSIMKTSCLMAFEVYRSKGYFEDMGNACFDFLWRTKVLQMTKQRRNDIKEIARVSLLNKKKIELSSIKDLSAGRLIKSDIERIEKAERTDELVVESKKIAINEFFKDLVDTGTELIEIIKK